MKIKLAYSDRYDILSPVSERNRVMKNINKTFTVFWKTDDTINFKAFPMVKGQPDHKAFNDAIGYADVVRNTESDVRIECRKRNDRDGWDIEQIWPNENN